MEKNSDNLLNLSNLPSEIQQHIASYLDARALGFFAQSDKRTLKNALPLLVNYQATFPLQLAARNNNTYLYQSNQFFACGYNEHCQLGLGDYKNRKIFTAIPWPTEQGKIQQVIVGWHHTIVLTKENQLWVCGDNKSGQLGLGDQTHRLTFTTMLWPKERGRIQQVIAGSNYTVVLTEDNQLWGCGNNESGQLGLGDNQDRLIFTAMPWPAERGQIQQVVAGREYIVVLTQDNRLWICGSNDYGELGLGDRVQRVTFTAVPWPAERGRIQQAIAGSSYTVILTEDNRLWGCGANNDGQLGLGDNRDRLTFTAVPWPEERGKIQQVVTGLEYMIVHTQNNQLWVCGYNGSGQLGLGDDKHRANFTMVPWPAERGRIQYVIAGWSHTVVLTEDNQLWVCGYNPYGQLGLGNLQNLALFTSVKKLPPGLQEIFTLNNNVNQLIKIGTALKKSLS